MSKHRQVDQPSLPYMWSTLVHKYQYNSGISGTLWDHMTYELINKNFVLENARIMLEKEPHE